MRHAHWRLVSVSVLCAIPFQLAEGPLFGDLAPDGAPIGSRVVLFKFKPTATKEQIEAVEDAFAALPAKIPQIRDFQWGTDMSVENLTDGYTHCFVVTFDTPEDRAVYLPHREHKKFGTVLRPILDKVLVVDYIARK